MRKATCHIQPAIASYRLHLDSGANMSLTNDETKLINFRYIKRHAIAGVADGSPALYATGVGYLPWRSEDNKTLLVKCFYSHQAAETVISPNDVVLNHISDYSGWTQHGNVDDGQGYIAFHHRNSNNTTKFHLTEHNGLWYNHVLGFTDTPTCRLLEDPAFESTATMRRMTPLATFALLHDRTGHPNDDTTKELWKHLEDCPKVKRNPFWKCPSCMKIRRSIDLLTKSQVETNLSQKRIECSQTIPRNRHLLVHKQIPMTPMTNYYLRTPTCNPDKCFRWISVLLEALVSLQQTKTAGASPASTV
jgi:hypothetical protein